MSLTQKLLICSWFAIAATPSSALAVACHPVMQRYFQQQRTTEAEQICQCGRSLRSLKISTPKGLTLVGVCHLQKDNGTPVDLRKETVSLDTYKDFQEGETRDYGWYWADVFFAGSLVLDGTVQIGPASEGGDMWFYPKPGIISNSLKQKSPAFSGYFAEIDLWHDAHRNIFKSPYPVGKNIGCAHARARVSISGLHVHVSEQDDNGTTPLGLKVIGVSRYKNCAESK